jgi:cytidylate kinase
MQAVSPKTIQPATARGLPEEPTMIATADLERSHTFIQCHLGDQASRSYVPHQTRLAVTISREAGTGGVTIAKHLAEYLQSRRPTHENPWTVYDRNLVEKVIEEHGLPKEVSRYMTEDRISFLDDIVEELCGLHPSAWTMVEKTSQTILRLADHGNAIIVGRGAAVLTQKLPHVFHVRLVGSLERRIERLSRRERIEPKAAREMIAKADQARSRYLQQYFRQHIEQALLYDLVLNTDRVRDELAARVIGEAALGLTTDSRAD